MKYKIEIEAENIEELKSIINSIGSQGVSGKTQNPLDEKYNRNQGEFKPTEEHFKKWAEEPATQPQINKLKKMGYNRNPNKLTKLEAYQLIKEKETEQKGEDPEGEEGMYL